MIGVPSGKDRIYFNAARTYGPIMLAHLFANYEVIYSEAESFEDDLNHSSEYQPIFVLGKLEWGQQWRTQIGEKENSYHEKLISKNKRKALTANLRLKEKRGG